MSQMHLEKDELAQLMQGPGRADAEGGGESDVFGAVPDRGDDEFVDEWDMDYADILRRRMRRRSTRMYRVPQPGEEQDEVNDDQPEQAQPEQEQASDLVDVPVDRPMVPMRAPERVPAEENFAGADAAGIGRVGGWRGLGRQLKRNPLALFPRRLYRGIRSLWSGITRAFGRWRTRRAQAREAAAQAAQAPAVDPLEAPAVPEQGEGGAAGAGSEPVSEPPPTVAVDPESRYGAHLMAQHQAREDLAAYRTAHPGPVRMPQAPQGSMLQTLRAGQPLGDDASSYVSAARAKAAELEEQYDKTNPDSTANYPFSQRTLADKEHSGAARAGQVITQFGAAINDRDDVMADPAKDPKLAAAQKALNITANLAKSGMKNLDETVRKYAGEDYKEKIGGTTAKAFADMQKTGQFYVGFVGKDVANGIDAATESKAGAHFFKDNPALVPNTWDRIGRNADGSIGFGPGVGPATHVEIMPGSNGGPAWNYDKNVNMLAAGKFLEHPANLAQAVGTGMTESFGQPYDQAHGQRADLVSRQFQTSIYRSMMAANMKAQPDAKPFPNATAKMWQAIAREHKAATALGKPMLREGYSSNYALSFARTANLNDSIHKRRAGFKLQKALADRQRAEPGADAITKEQLEALSPLTWAPRKQRDSVFRGSLQQATDRDEVPGRVVRKREGLGRGLAHVGNAVGTTLDVVGGVLAFDAGESDLKEGELKKAAAKSFLSEVYQNGATAGLGYAPGVGKYAKTYGLAVLTPAGTGLQKVGKGLQDIAFGKEDRDREYNRHWGLVDPYALEDGDMRAHHRWEERSLSTRMQRARSDYAAAQGTEGASRARERYLAMMGQARELEGELGRSRRRDLARTGYVERARAEVTSDLNTPQVPLTEAQLQAHREQYPSSLAAALPKDVPVYAKPYKPAPKPEAPASDPLEAGNVAPKKDPHLFDIAEESEEDEPSMKSERPRPHNLIEEEDEGMSALPLLRNQRPLIEEEDEDPFR